MARETKPTVIFIDEVESIFLRTTPGGESDAVSRLKN